jgi:hypothetical protein
MLVSCSRHCHAARTSAFLYTDLIQFAHNRQVVGLLLTEFLWRSANVLLHTSRFISVKQLAAVSCPTQDMSLGPGLWVFIVNSD